MTTARRFLAPALVSLLSVNLGYSFDIAIYKDPLSYWNERFLRNCRFADWPGYDRATDSTHIFGTLYNSSQMDDVYEWYRDMQVTKVMVIYPYADDFDQIPQDSSGIKVMNWFYPGLGTMHGDKYVDAQFRDVQVGLNRDLDPTDPNRYWSYGDAIGDNAARDTITFLDSLGNLSRRPVVRISGSAGDLWLPTSYLGNMSGWDWYTMGWLDSSFYMPMHFKLTWAVDPNDTVQITTSTPLADFYWIVQIPENRQDDFPLYARWWQFPAKTITLNPLSDSTDWNESYFYEDAQSGEYMLLDEHFDTLSPVSWEEIYFGPTNRPRGLDEVVPWDEVSYGGRAEVRMAVHYRGTHSFYLNRIEVYDEGAYRMFALSN